MFNTYAPYIHDNVICLQIWPYLKYILPKGRTMFFLTCDRNIYLPEWNFAGNSRMSCYRLNFCLFKCFFFYWLISPKTELATVHFVSPTRNFGDIAHFYLQYLFLHQNPFYPAPLPPNITQIQLLLYIPMVESFGFREGAAYPAGDSLCPYTGPPAPSTLLHFTAPKGTSLLP